MKIKYVFALVLCLLSLEIYAAQTVTVLAVDHNHDHIINSMTINKGQDIILLKQNPSKLTPGQLSFQTANNNLFVPASWDDLSQPNAMRKVFAGKMTKKGLKTYTLNNLGYVKLQSIQQPNGTTVYMLLTPRGTPVKIDQIAYSAPLPTYTPVDASQGSDLETKKK